MGLTLPPTPVVHLLGAGPGDPELLTVKGFRVLQQATAILYDALIDKRILDIARPDIPKIYVGKRCGLHSLSQDDINALIIATARQYGGAVRLKGGDPFIFGRGGEEAMALQAAGIEVEIIPGLSSATAVPALAGIPSTHRGISRGFWVLTATTRHHQLPAEMEQAARSSSTVIILMGTRKIGQIATLFKKYRAPNTPMSLLLNGSRMDATRINGTLATPPTMALPTAATPSPGILVIGPVAGIELNRHTVTAATMLGAGNHQS